MRAVVVLFALCACVEPPPPDDAGPGGPVCDGAGEPGVALGEHGAVWKPFDDGAQIPCFDRPQGGVGTHLTARFTGFPIDDNGFALLHVDVLAQDDGAVIAAYRTRAFALDCQGDGSLLLVDIPVRFDVTVESAADVDQVPAMLSALLELDDDTTVQAAPIPVTLFESPFIPPAWWDQ